MSARNPQEAETSREGSSIVAACVLATAIWAIALFAAIESHGTHLSKSLPEAQAAHPATRITARDVHEAYERLDRELGEWARQGIGNGTASSFDSARATLRTNGTR